MGTVIGVYMGIFYEDPLPNALLSSSSLNPKLLNCFATSWAPAPGNR